MRMVEVVVARRNTSVHVNRPAGWKSAAMARSEPIAPDIYTTAQPQRRTSQQQPDNRWHREHTIA